MYLDWNEAPPQPDDLPFDGALWQTGAVRGMWSSVRANMQIVRSVFDRLAQNEQNRWQAIINVNADSSRTTDWRIAQKQQIASNALQQIDAIVQSARDARDAVYTKMAQSEQKALSPSGQEGVLQEMQVQAAWNRIKPVLDRFPAASVEFDARLKQFMQTAIADGDLATMRALKREVPAYLEGRDMVGSSAKSAIDEAMMPMLPAVARACISIREEVERGMRRLPDAVFLYQRMANNENFPRPDTLPGWSA